MRRTHPRPRVPIVLLAALMVLAAACGESEEGSIQQTRPVEITGEALPVFPEAGADPAVGMEIPELSGASFDGTAVEIADDGRPKVLLILAHW